ncbi:hypothetical protein HBB16_19105 [Pseudonocardia sp. MCCB 268]|nr:hypothetical protein [Pseudonocardia cytotoxica]
MRRAAELAQALDGLVRSIAKEAAVRATANLLMVASGVTSAARSTRRCGSSCPPARPTSTGGSST